MKYKIREISEELNIPESTIRGWLYLGAPHSRDKSNHIWIIGTEFYEWIRSHKKEKPSKKLTNNQAYCFKCKKPVFLKNPVIIPKVGKLILISGFCSICNSKINRGGRNVGTSSKK